MRVRVTSTSLAIIGRVASEQAVPPEVGAAPESARFGAYVRVQLLGAGGMGEVWKAWDGRLGRWVALKILRGGLGSEIGRFKAEAGMVAKLSHPNIASVFEVGEQGERCYIAMQYVEGVTLKALAPKDPRVLAEVVRDAARAIHHANVQQVVHRDVKPDNIMVQGEDGARRVFVMDFGLAKQLDAPASFSLSGMVVGTPAYMAPEQARGDTVDARADVYGLGATIYEMLQARPPFEGKSAMDIMVKVVHDELAPLPGEIGLIVAKAMDKEKELRYPTAEALADELQRWLSGEPITATRASLVYRMRKRIAKKRQVVLTAVLGALAVAATLVFLLPRWQEADRERRQAGEKLVMERVERLKQLLRAEREAVEAAVKQAEEMYDDPNRVTEAHEPARVAIARAGAIAEPIAKEADPDVRARIGKDAATLARLDCQEPIARARRVAGLSLCRRAWRAWVLKEDYDAALAALEEAMTASGGLPEVRAYRGLLHLRGGRLDAAAADLEAAGNDEFVRIARAGLALERGAPAEAAKLLGDGRGERDEEVHALRGMMALAEGDAEGAIAHVRAAGRFTPTSRAAADLLLLLARAHLQLGRAAEARKELKPVVERLESGQEWGQNASRGSGRRGQPADAYLLFGRACLELGEREEARKALEKALQRRPDHAETQRLLERVKS